MRKRLYTSLWMGLSTIILPIYTIVFATKESPLEFTLSNIGNFFGIDHRISFIIWGIVTAVCLAVFIGFMFRKVNFQNPRARRLLLLSSTALILTVLTPALKEIMPVFYYLHVLYSVVFPVCLVSSLYLFLQFLQEADIVLPRFLLVLLDLTILIPFLIWFLMGFNGLVELIFILLVSISLFILNRYIS